MEISNTKTALRHRICSAPLPAKVLEIVRETTALLTNKFFYIGALSLFVGIKLNYYSQGYLLNLTQNGTTLPMLSDLILDNIPLWKVDYLYDIFAIVSLLTLMVFVIHKRRYGSVPYFLLLSGIFQIIRGFFIVLTPFGNPMGFDGTQGPFNGFTDIELGVYPSGHTGIAFLYFLLVTSKPYRYTLLFSVSVIMFALFFSRGHYTIDILSGIFFAYAIKSYGDKHFRKYFDNLYVPQAEMQ
jgi:hypothetical protein